MIDPFIQPFWRSVASKLPSNLAPNMITLIGLLFNVAGFLAIAMYAGGDATKEAPSKGSTDELIERPVSRPRAVDRTVSLTLFKAGHITFVHFAFLFTR